MKNVYYWIIIGILLAGFIVMSLILIQGLVFVKEVVNRFFRYFEELIGEIGS